MKHLFSPWRSAYIQTFKEIPQKKECLFCAMIKEKKDEKNLVVLRGRTCFLVLNRYPYNSGHIMIVPYKHCSKFESLPIEVHTEVMELTSKCIKALTKLMKPHGFNFGANIGRAGGAGIDKHIHFHIVPRWNGDTNFFPVLGDVKVISESLGKTREQLYKLLKKR